MTDCIQYIGGANWRVKKQSHISISKAPGALFRENTVMILQHCVKQKFDRYGGTWKFHCNPAVSVCALVFLYSLVRLFIYRWTVGPYSVSGKVKQRAFLPFPPTYIVTLSFW